MNYLNLYGLTCWLALFLSSSQLSAQSYPTNFCSDNSEISSCYFGTPTAALHEIYGIDAECLAPALSNPFPTIEGNTACYPFFGSPTVKLSDEDFSGQLNSERSAWNAASDLAFFRGPNNSSITFFDEQGDKIDDHQFYWKDFYQSFRSDWTDKLTTVRWHPTEDAIFYPKEHQLIKRSVSVAGSHVTLGTAQVIASFSGYTIGMGYGQDHRIAGGDGNDVNAGRFLISLVRSGNTEYVVYDFNEDAIITQNVTLGSSWGYSESPRSVSSFAGHLFSLPQLDYAQVSASGLFIVAMVKDGGTEQIELYDFDGNRYDISDGPTSVRNYLFSDLSHNDVTFVEVESDLIRECIVVRTTGNTTPANGDGDVNALYWWIDKGDSVVQWDMMKLLDWRNSSSQLYSGAQYSAVLGFHEAQESVFHTPGDTVFSVPDSFSYRMLASMRQVTLDTQYVINIDNGNGCNPWRRYMGEIVELSLTYRDSLRDATVTPPVSSTTPRRIVHHRVEAIVYPNGSGGQDTFPILQPEAWFSPDGAKVFFKSPDVSTTNIDDEHLFFINVGKRTCQDQRINFYGSTYRLAQQGALLPPNSVRIYPNPVSLGRSMWLELDADIPGFHGELTLTDMGGRSQSVWQGMMSGGLSHKISLPHLAPGMYVAELGDGSGVRHRQKVVLR